MRIGSRAAAAALALLVITMTGSPASAAKRLTASKTKKLDRSGETVTVTGRGYDETKGIYVAFCLDNGAGVLPSPCGGGQDMSGSSGASVWISSNPPSYAEGLTKPYGKNGSFTVSIRVSQMIGEIDCAVRACAIVTRNDHTRTGDRSQDVRIPVRFAAPSTVTNPTPAPGTTRTATTGSGTKTTASGKASAVGPPTGKLATAVPPTVATVAALEAAEPTLNRTSSATPLGHWWSIGGAFLVGILAAGVLGRIRRPKTKQEKA
ncbi:hypothetical protein [Actinoplanes derwentensis]|uniref:Neocarzinostatin family protein n=1 Tax=Actinoplanes derwentensis TaxID=113562 RepID=A0A1H2CWP9_9ACTN|nr:hypothetical protein [Actinoplanes derwentensis]SDT74935.1 hypothetical protein SAMN04489716_7142 [Actinoplanes derwentensis]